MPVVATPLVVVATSFYSSLPVITGLVGLPRKKSRTNRLKSAVRSIIYQCPQCENTARSALSINSSSL